MTACTVIMVILYIIKGTEGATQLHFSKSTHDGNLLLMLPPPATSAEVCEFIICYKDISYTLCMVAVVLWVF